MSNPDDQQTPDATAPSQAVRLRAGDPDRRSVASLLHDALGKGQLSIEEFDERTAAAWAAVYLDDLKPLTADLPQGVAQSAASGTGGEVARVVTGEGSSATSVAVFSGTDRSGVWTVPAQQRAIAVMGGVRLDLRHANLGAEYVEIIAVAIMGGIEIIVPDDIHVEVRGFAMMGGFTDERRWRGRRPTLPPGAPRLVVKGFAFWGGVAVSRRPSGPRDELERE